MQRAARWMFFAFALALPVSGGAEAWDAARVLESAEALRAEIGAVLDRVPDAPEQRTTLQQRTRDAAVVQMRRAQELSEEYTRKLRGGWDREESEPYFVQVRSAVREVRRTARDAVPQKQVAPHLERIDELLERLGAYYEFD